MEHQVWDIPGVKVLKQYQCIFKPTSSKVEIWWEIASVLVIVLQCFIYLLSFHCNNYSNSVTVTVVIMAGWK